MKITEHISVYASVVELETVSFNSTEELLDIPFVKAHSKRLEFYRYSIKKDQGSMRIPLLAEYLHGKKWLVVGFIECKIDEVNLPEWKPLE